MGASVRGRGWGLCCLFYFFGRGVNGGGGVPDVSVAGPPVMPTTGKGRGTSFPSPAVGKVGPEVMRAAIEGVNEVFRFRTLIGTHANGGEKCLFLVTLCSFEVWVLTFAMVPRDGAGRTGPP